jgi:chorismate mutase
MKYKKLEDWGLTDINPLIISGPCSAETEEQVLETAKDLKRKGVTVFRAGIWKPRTRPNSFEGVGAVGLNWLAKAKKETGMLLSTEVANAKHVRKALKAGVDILWVGARTTVNPFAVQEIADALKGVDIPIFVKNPINPDLELWIGAMERINQAGITKIGAIHRGFSSYEHSKFRNAPQWQIPIELKRRFPDLPIICDPSHIGGTRDLIMPVSQKAMDLDFDGLMIESHCNPDEAWSDAKQQITPDALGQLMSNLVLREVKPEKVTLADLDDLRFKIDQYDLELIEILGKRMKTVGEIGEYKKKNDMTILQTARWDTILSSRLQKGEGLNLSEEIIKSIFKAIHQESINKQEEILTR